MNSPSARYLARKHEILRQEWHAKLCDFIDWHDAQYLCKIHGGVNNEQNMNLNLPCPKLSRKSWFVSDDGTIIYS